MTSFNQSCYSILILRFLLLLKISTRNKILLLLNRYFEKMTEPKQWKTMYQKYYCSPPKIKDRSVKKPRQIPDHRSSLLYSTSYRDTYIDPRYYATFAHTSELKSNEDDKGELTDE